MFSIRQLGKYLLLKVNHRGPRTSLSHTGPHRIHGFTYLQQVYPGHWLSVTRIYRQTSVQLDIISIPCRSQMVWATWIHAYMKKELLALTASAAALFRHFPQQLLLKCSSTSPITLRQYQESSPGLDISQILSCVIVDTHQCELTFSSGVYKTQSSPK